MHKYYFPRCPVDGPVNPPVPYGHMASKGAVPQKCATCRCLFEGECLRYVEQVNRYLHLDHGACGINGPTDPVLYHDGWIDSKVEIPRKCASCSFLAVDQIRGFHCTKDADKWGDLHRGLDWGAWEPDVLYFELPLPKVTTRKLARFAQDNDQIGFIQEYRRTNPGFPIQEAKVDFVRLREILDNQSNA